MYFKSMELGGRLVADPEFKAGDKMDQKSKDGQTVSSNDRAVGSICVQNVFRKDDEPEFFRYVAWGPQARIMANYCKKGKIVRLSGKPQSRHYDDPTTNKRQYVVELVVREVNLGEDAKSQSNGSPEAVLSAAFDQVSPETLQKLMADALTAKEATPEQVETVQDMADDDNPFPG